LSWHAEQLGSAVATEALESSGVGYDSELVDLAQVALADLPQLDHSTLRQSLLRLVEQADDPQNVCAGFNSAL